MTDDLDYDLRAELNDDDARMDRRDEWLKQLDNDDMVRRGLITRRPSWPAPLLEQLLEFEAAWPGFGGKKVDAIRTTFGGMNRTRYYQILNRAINTREALELNPMLVNRLRAHRTKALQARASRTFHIR